MPAYLPLIRIDWHLADTPAELRTAIAAVHDALTSGDHTVTTFEEQLRAFAHAHPAAVADVLIEDGYRGYMIFRVERGDVRAASLEQRPADALGSAIDLPLDHVARVRLARDIAGIVELVREQDEDACDDDGELDLPLVYSDVTALRAIADRIAAAMTGEPERFVAEVELDRYLVELAPGRACVRELVFVGDRALAERLLGDDYDAPEPPRVVRDPAQKYELALYWPESMLRAIRDEAVRCDKSLSWIVQYAWKTTSSQIARSDRDALASAVRSYDGAKRKQSLFFPGAMADQIEAEAARLDVSRSLVAQAAFALACAQITALPGVA